MGSDTLQPHGLQPIRLLCPWNLQARILEWVAIPFFRGSSWPRDRTWVSCTAGRFFTVWATREEEALSYLFGDYLTAPTSPSQNLAKVSSHLKSSPFHWFGCLRWEEEWAISPDHKSTSSVHRVQSTYSIESQKPIAGRELQCHLGQHFSLGLWISPSDLLTARSVS